jgi:hypothetical protein
MMLWEIFIPTVSNEGKPFRTRHHKEWDSRVRAISHGLTIMMPAKGQWIDIATGELYHDRVIPVRISCNEVQIQKIMEMTAKHYNQIAVMAYKISDEVKYYFNDPNK